MQYQYERQDDFVMINMHPYADPIKSRAWPPQLKSADFSPAVQPSAAGFPPSAPLGPDYGVEAVTHQFEVMNLHQGYDDDYDAAHRAESNDSSNDTARFFDMQPKPLPVAVPYELCPSSAPQLTEFNLHLQQRRLFEACYSFDMLGWVSGAGFSAQAFAVPDTRRKRSRAFSTQQPETRPSPFTTWDPLDWQPVSTENSISGEITGIGGHFDPQPTDTVNLYSQYLDID
jgi:hypothetical protein